jgi:hypothetical protein
VLEPVAFIARLAALVPPPRVHLTRYHGVFAANAALRAAITPAGRGSKARSRAPERATPKHVALNGAQRLNRVFGSDGRYEQQSRGFAQFLEDGVRAGQRSVSGSIRRTRFHRINDLR